MFITNLKECIQFRLWLKLTEQFRFRRNQNVSFGGGFVSP